jgi:flagellar basal-body rod modification protein FlgD
MNVAPTTGTSANGVNGNENGATTNANDSLANKDAFLQLLIAQIKNQDPLNPADGLEFLTQLAQFSQLEQLMGIRNDLQALGNDAAAAGSESGSSGAPAT